jgi:non-specific serine/threonine protein kinase
MTSFIGREWEVATVGARLRTSDVRLLTLTGAGGIGKTRLAIQIASELQDIAPQGVWFVDLAPISDPALVLSTIAQALGVREQHGMSVGETLCTALHEQQLLLLIDNFEQVVSAAPEVALLLAAVPGLKLLVTSREALCLYGEHVIVVAPLAVPDPAAALAPEHLAQYAAAQLFVARAQASSEHFCLTDANAPAVAAICARLDGLPLAIELAAAQIRLFSPPALLTRLEQRLPMLTRGPRDLPARQQTIHNTIEWSYHLLEAGEQTLFARLGVFVGGCAIAAAEAVCGESGVLAGGIVEGLAGLIDKSLLRQVARDGDEPRFLMLETIREYALAQLEQRGEGGVVRAQHHAYNLKLAEAAAPARAGAEQRAWLDRLQQEHDNLRAALGWTVEQQQTAIGLRLATALRLFWFMRGYLTEGRERLAQVLALGDGAASARAKALDCAGLLARYQGDYAAATALISESLALWRGMDDTQGVADALGNLAYVMLYQSNYQAARALYEESMGLNHAAGNEQGRADCLSHLGDVAFYQGDDAAAQALHEESLAIWGALGDIQGVAYTLYNLGDVALSRADEAAAARRFKESLAVSVELGWQWGIVSAVEGVMGLAALHRRAHVALRLAGFAARLRKTLAIPLSPAREQMLMRRLEPARKLLDEPACAAAWAEGEALALEQAVTEALGDA